MCKPRKTAAWLAASTLIFRQLWVHNLQHSCHWTIFMQCLNVTQVSNSSSLILFFQCMHIPAQQRCQKWHLALVSEAAYGGLPLHWCQPLSEPLLHSTSLMIAWPYEAMGLFDLEDAEEWGQGKLRVQEKEHLSEDIKSKIIRHFVTGF